MGNTSSSKLQQALKSPDTYNLSPKTRYYGFENFGNTCYCNSVLQALYHCARFRQRVREFAPLPGDPDHKADRSLLVAIAQLFDGISNASARTGVIGPHTFLKRLRASNELFRAPQQQDAHEFLNYLLNDISNAALAATNNNGSSRSSLRSSGALDSDDDHDNDDVPEPSASPSSSSSRRRRRRVSDNTHVSNGVDHSHASNGTSTAATSNGVSRKSSLSQSGARANSTNSNVSSSNTNVKKRSFVQDLFEGVLTNETRCLRCETVTSRNEPFLDLSVDVTQNSSISHCFANFCAVERLAGGNKFFCDACNTLQEAHKSLHVRRAPPVLVLHLKRFKFVDRYNCHKKLSHRVAFPFDLRLNETSASGVEQSCRYSLLAVVVHRGGGPNSGHYFSYVRSESNWLVFNDQQIDLVDRATIQAVFGSARETTGATVSTAYILFYERVDGNNSAENEEGG